ncbi:ATPase [Pseudarthrobacter sulfonivorans]|uniref:ATPase n=1 Tax=Pseudarthrobacter sulfonivorans TaxID=121292 RepID=A0A0U3FYI3_9MICC|nr:ATPase [Pseudarthrobacter sulfonivorans]
MDPEGVAVQAEDAEAAAAPVERTEVPAAPVEESAAGDESAADEAPAPAPAAAPRPAPSPAAFAARPKPAAAAPVAAPAPVASATSLAEAAKWGRVEGDGHVFLTIDGDEHPVGQYPGVSNDEALAYFARKHDDIVAQVLLLEQRISSKAPSTDMQKTVTHLREQLAERNMVGDLRSTEARLDAVSVQIAELEKAEKAEHDAVRSAELAAREAIVAEAEEISGQDPAQIQWKTSSARMNDLFESWKTAQKGGIRLGRSNEDALWKRFRAARTVFDRHRRAYFSQLDSTNSAAKSAKEKLIAEAEALSSSTDWGFAAGEYRRLMDEWKASPRASRKDDDALWARFRAAQDVFFTHRQAANEEIDQEYAANLTVKEALLVEANTILPVKDLAAAKKALQSVRDRWEEAGKVPRADMGRIEAGLRKVEDAVRNAEEENWQRSNPETKARTNSALSQLEAAISGLQDDLAKAEKAGDQRKIKGAREALEARQAWLDQIQRSASELS